MARLTVDDVKTILRFDATDDDGASDSALGQLLTICLAQIEGYLGRAVYAENVHSVARASYARVTGLRVSDDAPNTRFVESIIDPYLREDGAGPSAMVGADAALEAITPDFGTWIEATVNGALLDWIAERWFRPNPGEQASGEGGVRVQFQRSDIGIPPRIVAQLKPVRDLSTRR